MITTGTTNVALETEPATFSDGRTRWFVQLDENGYDAWVLRLTEDEKEELTKRIQKAGVRSWSFSNLDHYENPPVSIDDWLNSRNSEGK